MRGDEVGLLRLVRVRHFLGVAARGLGLLEFLVLDRDEFCAKGLDLFLGRGTHVGRCDHGAEAPAGGDRLQAGDADAHDEQLRGRDRAGGGHHHRQGPTVFGRGVDHRAIASKVCLARQHVHRLGAGYAREKLHGERCHPGLRHRLDRLAVFVRVHRRDDDGIRPEAGNFAAARPANLQYQIGA